MVLNTGPLDWESSALTTRPLQLINSRYTINSTFINTKSSNVNLPPVFNHWFTFSSDSHNYETSSSSKGLLKIKTVNTKKYGRAAMTNNAVSSWNNIQKFFHLMYYETFHILN